MRIFVLTATYELRGSRKSHLRDHPTSSMDVQCVSLSTTSNVNVPCVSQSLARSVAVQGVSSLFTIVKCFLKTEILK
jgi:hypothetical protein